MQLPDKRQMTIKKTRPVHPSDLVDSKPAYTTNLGAAYVGDAQDLLKLVPSRSVKAIITSPP
jgi:hypothetical protein